MQRKIWSENLPIAGDGFERAVISTQRDVESHHSLARFDEIKVLIVDTSKVSSLVEEELDLFEETGLKVLVEPGTELGEHWEWASGNYRWQMDQN